MRQTQANFKMHSFVETLAIITKQKCYYCKHLAEAPGNSSCKNLSALEKWESVGHFATKLLDLSHPARMYVFIIYLVTKAFSIYNARMESCCACNLKKIVASGSEFA